MSVYRGVSGCSSQILALSVWNVLAIRVLEALGKPEVDDENRILGAIVSSDQEVVRFDVSMNDSLFMNLFNALYLFRITVQISYKDSVPFGCRQEARS